MRSAHISDEDILRTVDGELRADRARAIQAHLASCPRCQKRKSELERASAALAQLTKAGLDPQIPDATAPTIAFRRRLITLTSKTQAGSLWQQLRCPPYLMSAVVGISLIGLVVVLVHSSLTLSASAASLPNTVLTPGAVRQISKEQLCSMPAEDEGRTVPSELAMRVFHEYGIQKPRPRAYEMDYLITPALGGTEDIRNLWPQPYEGSVWTARVKDALEDHLLALVCRGEIDLVAAQNEMASNWIRAYQKYFRTRRPLPAHSVFIKDEPWE
jgi:hypothetical protein